MTLTQLRYFVRMVECGSLTRAAEQLFVSQPSLSAALRDLESEFSLTLFYRNSKGLTLTPQGLEFLAYAQQVLEQADLLEHRYKGQSKVRQLMSVSTQHYFFAVNAFVRLLKGVDSEEYEITLRETRTHEIIEDVANFRSEIGIIYLSGFNSQVLSKILREKRIATEPLFVARPHVFMSAGHPLAGRQELTMADLGPYPYLRYEQGTSNSFYFSEEIDDRSFHPKVVNVSDRATLFNLAVGINGYTISTGVIAQNLNLDNIVAVPLRLDEEIRIVWLRNERIRLSAIALRYIEELRAEVRAQGFELLS